MAVASGGIAVVLYDLVPEKAGCQEVSRVAGVGIAVGRPDELGHLRVAMFSIQDVLMPLEGLYEGAVFEFVGKVQPAFVPCVGIEIDHDFVHAPELGVQHALDLACIERSEDALRPLGELDLDIQGRFVSGVAVGIPQAGICLVQGVPG